MVIRSLKFVFEILAALVAIVVVLGVLLVWRVASEPVQSTYLPPLVETGLEFLFPNTEAKVENAFLVWDPSEHTIAIRSDNVLLEEKTKNTLVSIPSLRLRFAFFPLLVGQYAPELLVVDGLKVELEKDQNGELKVLKADGSETTERSDSGTTIKEIAALFLAQRSLDKLAITNTTLVLRDHDNKEAVSISLPKLVIEKGGDGLVGKAQFEIYTDAQTAVLNVDYSFSERNKSHVARVAFSQLVPSKIEILSDVLKAASISMPLDGTVLAGFDNDFNLHLFDLNLKGGEGDLAVSAMWDAPLHVKKMTMAASLDPKTNKITGPTIEADLGGPLLSLQGKVDPAADGNDALELAIKLKNVPIDSIGSIWPKEVIPNAIDWIKTNMSKGVFTEGDITLAGHFKWNDIENMTLDTGVGKLAAKGATVQYIEGVPPVEDVSAEADYDLRHMNVRVTAGHVGDLKLLPSEILLTDFEKDVQQISIPLKISGPAHDVLRIIDAPPLGYTKAIGLYPNDVSGHVEGLLTISLPLLQNVTFDDVSLKANAKLSSFSAPKLISGYAISEGKLDLALNLDGFTLKGPASFNGVPLNLSWVGFFEEKPDRPLYQADLTGDVIGDQWKALGVEFLSKPQGTMGLTLKFVQPNPAMATLSGTLDFLKGGFRMEKINWDKPVGKPLSVVFAADMPTGKDITIKSIVMKGETEKANGSAVLDHKTGRLLNLDLKPLVAGRTNVNLKIVQSAKVDGDSRVEAEGLSLDVSGKDAEATEETGSQSYIIHLNKLYNSEDGYIENVTLHAKKDKIGWSEIAMSGLANGASALSVSLAPKLGDPRLLILKIETDDFGQVMKGMGYTNTVHGGSTIVEGVSTLAEPRKIEGNLKIGSFNVTGLPVLARLLSMASPFGFSDFLTGDSSFNRLEGKFAWIGHTITFKKVNALGSAYGVNIVGPLNIETGEADLHGTLVPLSFLNSVINAIPLVGRLVTGGDNQGVLAVAFSVNGNLSDPNISANPASLLTPGVLRNLFFNTGTD